MPTAYFPVRWMYIFYLSISPSLAFEGASRRYKHTDAHINFKLGPYCKAYALQMCFVGGRRENYFNLVVGARGSSSEPEAP